MEISILLWNPPSTAFLIFLTFFSQDRLVINAQDIQSGTTTNVVPHVQLEHTITLRSVDALPAKTDNIGMEMLVFPAQVGKFGATTHVFALKDSHGTEILAFPAQADKFGVTTHVCVLKD
jgi:hypothetical protein